MKVFSTFNSFIDTSRVEADRLLDQTDPKEIHRLALASHGILLERIARHPNTLPKTLRTIARDPVAGHFNWFDLVQNPNLPTSELRWIHAQITRPSVWKLIYAMASNVFIDKSVKDGQTLKYIAIHPNSPVALVEKLSRHKDGEIRFSTIYSSKLNLNIKKQLINDTIMARGYGNSDLLIKALSHPELHTHLRKVHLDQIIQGYVQKENLDNQDRGFFLLLTATDFLDTSNQKTVTRLLNSIKG